MYNLSVTIVFVQTCVVVRNICIISRRKLTETVSGFYMRSDIPGFRKTADTWNFLGDTHVCCNEEESY